MVLENKNQNEDEIVEVYDFTGKPSFVKGNNFQKSKSLSAAENTVSGQLADIQRKMADIQERRSKLGESQAEQAEKAKLNILTADLQDAANMIGGINTDLGERQRQEAQMGQSQLQQQESQLSQEMSDFESLQRQLEASQVGLLQEEEAQKKSFEQEQQAFQSLQREQERTANLNDPNSEASQKARQELAFLGVQVPEGFSAAQIESNKDLLLEVQKQQQARQLEQMKHERDLQLQLMKEERDLNKQLMLSDRKDAATLGQAQKRRSEGTMDAYFAAKDAIDLVNRAGSTPEPNQATDASLLEGYERLLRNQAITLDEDGRPIVNKTLLDQANSQIKVWKERLKGNKGILTAEDRQALVRESKNLYEVEQGFNVKKLKNIVDWSNQMSEKNPNINAGFIVPGIDPDILAQEYQEFFPEGDKYLSSQERIGMAQPTAATSSAAAAAPERKKFVPGQSAQSVGKQGSSGRKIFGGG